MTEPASQCELKLALAQLRSRSVDTIIVDGGDGTIRDVLSLVGPHYGANLGLPDRRHITVEPRTYEFNDRASVADA
ncbi:MAG: hypothetical protein QM690_12660 [Sphingobium sp.]